MPKYRFEIQSGIDVFVDAEDKELARMKIIENLEGYADKLIQDCYVSDGVEQKQ